jgi:hypothetical protein
MALFEKKKLNVAAGVEQVSRLDLASLTSVLCDRIHCGCETAKDFGWGDGALVGWSQYEVSPRYQFSRRSLTCSSLDKVRIIALYILFREGVADEDRRRLYQHARLSISEQDTINNLIYLGIRVIKVIQAYDNQRFSWPSGSQGKASRFTYKAS